VVKIEYKGAQAFSAAVHSDHVAHVCNSSKCAGISASRVVYPERFFAENAGASELRRLALASRPFRSRSPNLDDTYLACSRRRTLLSAAGSPQFECRDTEQL
jgi:hypothetical protein